MISDDAGLGGRLRQAANVAGQMLVRAEGTSDFSGIVRVIRPAVVLLDLDLSAEDVWEKAEAMLTGWRCPPVILLAQPGGRLADGTAIPAGSFVDKTGDPPRLLKTVDQLSAMPDSVLAEQNAWQRAVVLRLKPSNWPKPYSPTYRFWGINE